MFVYAVYQYTAHGMQMQDAFCDYFTNVLIYLTVMPVPSGTIAHVPPPRISSHE